MMHVIKESALPTVIHGIGRKETAVIANEYVGFAVDGGKMAPLCLKTVFMSEMWEEPKIKLGAWQIMLCRDCVSSK